MTENMASQFEFLQGIQEDLDYWSILCPFGTLLKLRLLERHFR